MLYKDNYYVLAEDPLQYLLPEAYVLEDYVTQNMCVDYALPG